MSEIVKYKESVSQFLHFTDWTDSVHGPGKPGERNDYSCGVEGRLAGRVWLSGAYAGL